MTGFTPTRTAACVRAAWLVLTVLTLLLPLTLLAAPPGDPLPPPDTGELPGVEEGETEGLPPATLEQQREAEFADHLGRAKRAMQQRRWQESIAEYTAALEVHDGDPEA